MVGEQRFAMMKESAQRPVALGCFAYCTGFGCAFYDDAWIASTTCKERGTGRRLFITGLRVAHISKGLRSLFG